MARGSGVSTPDKDHLHHRLIRLGHGHRRSVLILWAWTALLSGFVLYPLFTKHGNAVIPFAALGLGVALYTLFHPGLRRGQATDGLEDERADAGQRRGRERSDGLAEVISIDDSERQRAARPAADPKRKRG